MKRKVVIHFENCCGCPFITTREGYSSYYYECNKYVFRSNRITDYIDQIKVYEELNDWFKNKCKLEQE
jgi:hypothetical protein